MKPNKLYIKDYGCPEYLDGCLAQFQIYTDDDIIAYVFNKEYAEKIVECLNKINSSK